MSNRVRVGFEQCEEAFQADEGKVDSDGIRCKFHDLPPRLFTAIRSSGCMSPGVGSKGESPFERFEARFTEG